ncbi:hypothetical protein L7F22_005421 [Adiantum nelumboides]|nr:hypothetical protein [Adiantum nelumboides]
MINCPLAIAILMIRNFLVSQASPTTLLLYMMVIPAVFAFVVFSYVRKDAAAEEEEEEMINNDRNSYSSAMSTREWLAQRYVPCALEEAVVESIPLVKFFLTDRAASEPASSMSSSSCVVCLTPFQEDEELKVLPPCQHAFHPLCIDPWFETHSTCPVCRSEVTPPPASPLAKAGGRGIDEEGFASSCHELKHVPLIQVVVE